MKKLLLLIFCCCICIFSFPQVSTSSQWTWVKGDSALPQFPIYGTKGISSPDNKPGGREYAVSWRDASNNLWLFGGQGNGPSYSGSLNDLWKYDPLTNQWAWMSGDSSVAGVSVYGTKGTASANNTPGARTQSISWTDASGNLWLFGGFGNAVDGVADLNDLWKYDPSTNQWTWMSGDSTKGAAPEYGTQGVASAANKPGGRLLGVTWTDAAGKLWMFGGYGLSSFGYGRLNDLWQYDPATNEWTWIKGNTGVNTFGSYGTMGVADPSNLPPSRNSGVSWLDATGKFWIFGGINNSGNSVYNDLWQYDPATNNWTWMKGDNTLNVFGVYGTKGVAAPANNPGGRAVSISWTDASGKLWLFGGSAYAATTVGQTNDLWKYDPATNNWVWINGDSTIDVKGIYGAQGSFSSNNKPGTRVSAVSWTDQSGKLWLSGGNGFSALSNGSMNDLWQFDPAINQWAWMKGDTAIILPTVYGTQGIASSSNKPSQRNLSVSWTDNVGNLWMFGGSGYDAEGNSGILNDLWKFNPSLNQWTWMKGDSVENIAGVYGNKGVPAAGNKPGARAYAVSWSDNSGNLWLFGGFGEAATLNGNLNDLWKYNTSSNMWTWISGDSTGEQPGIYGSISIASPTNKPGGRQSSVSFTDLSGNLWLFGGRGKAASAAGFGGYLSDLWKYDPVANQWTWQKGDSTINKAGIYGTLGTPAANNKPGGRQNPVTWTDNSGNLLLFGGSGYAASNAGFGGYMNDLWKYDIAINQWTWIKGDSVINIVGNYGVQGSAATGNTPGARYGSISRKDNTGNLILFGGYGLPASDDGNGGGNLNDLWNYDPSGNQWTWVKGDSTTNLRGIYETQGVASSTVKPGTRALPVSWKDNAGNFWLYGGSGYAAVGAGLLNDLWRLNINTVVPVTWLGFNGILQNGEAVLNWSTANEFNNKGFWVQKSVDGQTFASIAFVAGAANSSIINSYSYSDAKLLNGANYYRLKQIDFDGRFNFSSIIKLDYDKFNWVVLGSPSVNNTWVQLQLDKNADVTIQLISINGSILQTINKGKISNGTYSVPLNLSNVARGIYLVKLIVDDKMYSKKIVK